MRRFEKVDSARHVKMPRRLTKHAAGYDFFSPCDITLPPHETTFIYLNVKAFMQTDEVLKIYSRSSIATAKNIVLRSGVAIIDADYYNNSLNEGNIILALYNDGDVEYKIKKDDRIAQGIFEKFLTVDDDVAEEERKGGLGSTGS